MAEITNQAMPGSPLGRAGAAGRRWCGALDYAAECLSVASYNTLLIAMTTFNFLHIIHHSKTTGVAKTNELLR